MMNKLVLDLYRRAHAPSTAIDPSNNMPYETTQFSADRFAQLVATECARIAAMVASSYLAQRQQVADFAEKNILAEGQTAAEEVQTRILSEFGVAESTHPEA